jgi:S-adenosylmethionine decarboxylase
VPISPLPSLRRALAHEVLVDVSGCQPELLSDVQALRALADALVRLLGVSVLRPPQLHRFDDTELGPGGVTALYLLSESHLALHSWPERSALLISLCCCRTVPEDDALAALLRAHLGPARLRFRRLSRDAP